MSADKPTTGPLEVGYYSTTDAFRAIHQHAAVMRPDRSLVAVTGPSTGKGAREALEFAQLFAAAPDLLAVCEALTEAMHIGADGYYRIGPMAPPGTTDGKGGKVEMLRAAIAKARGGA